MTQYQNPRHTDMANALRMLAADAVQKANSGHPGMPMGMADVATVLFSAFLNISPQDPEWPDRDRFVLSGGHGSMLLYSLLHLMGFEQMPMNELRNFRQLGSKTPGHPEVCHACGIETTTGPLGQGLATAVGMAIAERHLAARFGSRMVDHRTYVMVGDGDLMEGLSHEAASLAGHLGLSRLTVLYDDNQISIDGPTSLSFSDNTLARFAAYGWDTVSINGQNPEEIFAALAKAQEATAPTLIACRTTIGYGAPNKQGTSAVHGSPLGAEEVEATRKALGWPHPPFEIPAEILGAWRNAASRAEGKHSAWLAAQAGSDDTTQAAFAAAMDGALPEGLAETFASLKATLLSEAPKLATRQASGRVLEAIMPVTPELVGGSADLTPSNNTKTKTISAITRENFSGQYIHYGVREHAMAAAMNGLALHGGIIPYGGTFLTFSDYCRPAIRMSALMRQRVIYVMTHDSIGLGEDGPTHQPVEHLAALRAIPGLYVMRPADAMETAECWETALEAHSHPSLLALSRQTLPALRKAESTENLCARGAYEISPAKGSAKAVIFATGSEVHLAVEAQKLLAAKGIALRVVSVPCTSLFEEQDEDYKTRILGHEPIRMAVEAAVRFGWDRFIGSSGIFIGMPGFGESAPCEELFNHFGITIEAIVSAITTATGGKP
ncbi:MAG TPA: transketolase [Rhodospirillaceae bacterium]|nr:MAG: transketolase [Alphaproteobacteria bacterium GWF2_58_20]HAU29067.1 transketolase [Rhodospirillaceae bacterium]